MRRTLRPAVAPSPRRANNGRPCRLSNGGFLEPLESRTLFSGGDLDPTFGPGGPDGNGAVTTNLSTVNFVPSTDAAQTVVIQADNKILVGGTSDNGNGFDFALVRYNPDGSLDPTFGGGDGIVTTDFGSTDTVQALALTADGHVVAVGSTGTGPGVNWAIARYNPDGSLDPTFSPGGDDGDGKLVADFFTRADVANGVAIDSNNRIVVAGTATGQTTQIAVVRYNPDGTPDPSFDSDGQAFVDFFEGADAASDVKILDGNKVLVVGGSAPTGSYRRFVLVRFESDGSLDSTFGDIGKATADFGAEAFGKDVVVDAAGKYVVGGLVDAPGGSADPDYAVARFNADGTFDTTFGSGGRTLATGLQGSFGAHYGLARQSDGKLVLGGLAVAGGTAPRAFGMARFNPDGAIDATFAPGGIVRTNIPGATDSGGADLALQADGKIVMVGDATFTATGSDFAAVRYTNTISVPGSIAGTVFEDANGNGVRDAGEAPLSGWTVYQDVNGNGVLDTSGGTVSSTDVPKPIPDQNSTTSQLTMTGAGEILDVNVTLTIDHTYDPDLSVTLISPAGTRVLLFNHVGDSGTRANFDNTTFDDGASNSISAGVPPFSGSYRPQQPLAAFVGQNPAGVWKLEVTDTASEDVGTLRAWSVTISGRGEPSTVSGADGSYAFPNLTPGTYTIRQVVQPGFTQSAPASGAARVITVADGQNVIGQDFGSFRGTLPAAVITRKVFYNNSVFDGRTPAPNEQDLDAVAPDKQALLPGQAATFGNVTSYSKGINGIMIEMNRLSPSANLTAADFQFKAGNTSDPTTWATAPAPTNVVTLRSPIPEAPAQVLVTWADGAIKNEWLQVTTLANANTGLPAADVFYLGNLVGETGDDPSRLGIVSIGDEVEVRRHVRPRGATLASRWDLDRDGDVDAMDMLIVRRNIGRQLSPLGGTATGARAPLGAAPMTAATSGAKPQRVWSDEPAGLL